VPALFLPLGGEIEEKKVEPSSLLAWKVAVLADPVKDAGTVSVRLPSVSVPPEAVVIAPSLLESIEALPVHPAVLNVDDELVATSPPSVLLTVT